MSKSFKYENQGDIYKHVLNGGAIVADVREGSLIISPYLDRIGISLWLVTSSIQQKDTRVTLFTGKAKTDIVYAVRLFYHLAFPGTYEFYDQKGMSASKRTIITKGEYTSEPAARKPIPKTVERYYSEHISKGVPTGQAWALAWSRYCKYSYPGSKRCQRKPREYLTGR